MIGKAPTAVASDVLATRQDWALRIKARFEDSLHAILDVGNMLIQAKAALSHGDFEPMCKEDLPFTPRTAQRLMAVARCRRLAQQALRVRRRPA